jgi:hypothetical protein
MCGFGKDEFFRSEVRVAGCCVRTGHSKSNGAVDEEQSW